MSDEPKPILDLGSDFEVLEDTPVESEAAPGPQPASAPPASPGAAPTPAASAPAAAAPGTAPMPMGRSGPVRSTEAWGSLGLALALGGLLGDWQGAGSNVPHGLLLGLVLWQLLRAGLATVQSTGEALHKVLAPALVLYGGLRVAFAASGSDALASSFGWIGDPEGGQLMAVSGALLTLLGGALTLAAPTLGKAKDAKLPPAAPPLTVDKQFSGSLFAYLLVVVGLLMPWSNTGARGVDSLFGVLTMFCALVAMWASWVGMWKLWTMPLVTGKLGMMLFLAPIEAFLLGFMGLARQLSVSEPPEEGAIKLLFDAWPTSGAGEDVLVHGAGPLITMIGSGLALYFVFAGVKEANEMSKQRKAEEIAARKAARDQRKGGK